MKIFTALSVMCAVMATTAYAQNHPLQNAGLAPDMLQVFGDVNQPPALNTPDFVPLDLAGFVGGLEPVIAVQLNGAVKAYPVRILTVHGVVNDMVGGTPIAITYCGPCAGATVLKRMDGAKALTLQSAGAIYDGSLLLMDAASGALWQQRDGRAIANNTPDLEVIGAQIISMARFRQDHGGDAGALVLRDSAKSRIPSGTKLTLPTPKQSDLEEDDIVQEEVRIVGDKAWSLELLAQEKRLQQSDVIILWQPDSTFTPTTGPKP